ncbi:hypothetical protein D9619_006165 [Psilocybe cf. subviscida]|uniref:ADF-H domain-containing protein n=1 Tax=Psilocybe cf. subviscida TaxID=2480587 RepID=A0A8H5B4T2_9AGAR|nr:hypothetical protein D9619_006165 [Psilocybe cf. subviscida]
MALSMPNSAPIMAAYASVVDDEYNWLLLHYINESYNTIELHSCGKNGLEELKTKLVDNKVYIGFYRQEDVHHPSYIIINYVPASIVGLRRARAYVHARKIGAMFKEHEMIYSVDSPSLLTSNHIHEAILNPPQPERKGEDVLVFDPPEDIPQPPPSQPLPPLQPVRPQTALQPVRPQFLQTSSSTATAGHQPDAMPRMSFGAIYAPDVQPPGAVPPVPALPKGISIITSLLRRKRGATNRTDDGYDDYRGSELPPPTPPKDRGGFHVQAIQYTHSAPGQHHHHSALRHQRSHSMSDFAVISHDELVVEDLSYLTLQRPTGGKWAAAAPVNALDSPEERARKRREMKARREREEREAQAQEEERLRLIREEKERARMEEIEDEMRKKLEAEDEMRRIARDKRRKEQMEREEEERKQREMEERRRRERERRQEEHRRMEEWRMEQARREEIAIRQAEETKRREEQAWMKRIQEAETKAKRTKEESALTGWITIQNNESLAWKRRFYKFSGGTVTLVRSPEDTSTFLEKLELRNAVSAFKEWNQGYEELEAIPFSFVVEFKNQEHLSMFADSEEEKYKVLGLFKIAAGL